MAASQLGHYLEEAPGQGLDVLKHQRGPHWANRFYFSGGGDNDHTGHLYSDLLEYMTRVVSQSHRAVGKSPAAAKWLVVTAGRVQTNGILPIMKKDPPDHTTLQGWEPDPVIVHKVLTVWRSEHCLRGAQAS